jgi:hypothetical protein
MYHILKRFSETKPSPKPWDAAGCTFTDGNLILAGYQPKKKKPCINGIGGRKQKGETIHQTAFRETIEELFEFPLFPLELLRELDTISPSAEIVSDTYVELVFSFQDLEAMLQIIKGFQIQSPLYDKHPLTVSDLVFKRKVCAHAEISHLVLLPLVQHQKQYPFVDKLFLDSINTIKILTEEMKTE